LTVIDVSIKTFFDNEENTRTITKVRTRTSSPC